MAFNRDASRLVETFEDATSASNPFECRRETYVVEAPRLHLPPASEYGRVGLLLCGGSPHRIIRSHQGKPATLMQGYGDLHHPVSPTTRKPSNLLDQDCVKSTLSTRQAAALISACTDLDRKLAMPIGDGRGVGPTTTIPQRRSFRAAHHAIQKAVDLRQRFARRAGLHQGHGARFRRSQADRRQAAEALSRRPARSGQAVSLRPRRGYAVRRSGMTFILGFVDGGWNSARGTEESSRPRSVINGIPTIWAAIHYYIHSVEPEVSERPLAGQQAGRHGAAAGHIATCGSCVHPHGRLRSGGQNQPGCAQSIRRISRRWRAGHLPADAIQPQPTIHRHV